MFTIYFRVAVKDFDLLLSGECVLKQCQIIVKVFDIFFCNNKNQILIIKLIIKIKVNLYTTT